MRLLEEPQHPFKVIRGNMRGNTTSLKAARPSHTLRMRDAVARIGSVKSSQFLFHTFPTWCRCANQTVSVA